MVQKARKTWGFVKGKLGIVGGLGVVFGIVLRQICGKLRAALDEKKARVAPRLYANFSNSETVFAALACTSGYTWA